MIIASILRRSDPEPIEIASGVMALCWGAMLALFGSWSGPGGTLQPSHILNAVLWGVEWAQGSGLAIAGFIQLCMVELQIGPRPRATMAAALAFLWASVAVSFAYGAWVMGQPGTGLAVYSIFVLFIGWLVYRHVREIRVRKALR